MRIFKLLLVLTLLSQSERSFSQVFANGELDGIVGLPSVPPSWTDIPFTDPASQALSAVQASVDVCDAAGPNLAGGIVGNPFSGTTMVSGLHATDGGVSLWHEGIMQTVNGFTIGDQYSICFYQAVVKQMNCLDESGSWQVYFDNTLIATSATSNSALPFNSTALVWDLRTITFTATAATHVIKFIPFDDDANILTSAADITGALRMGLDLVSFGAPADPTITAAGPFCFGDPPLTLSAVDAGGTWSGTGITNAATGEFDPAVAGVGAHNITYDLPSGCGGTVSDMITINVTASSNAGWTSPGVICEADGILDLTLLITGDVGGTWSGAGVTGNNFDPSGLSGPITITYSVGTAPCDDSNQQNITVVSNPDPTWVAPLGLCSSAPLFDLTITVTGTAGGTWSGTGITGTNFDPSVGTQTITYTVGSGSCQQQLALTITVGVGGNASWTTLAMCVSDVPINLTANVTGDPGGTWSGTGMTGSVFDPFLGTQSITYTVGLVGCQTSSTQTITVSDPQISMSSANVSCFGLTDGTASVSVTGGSGSETYLWAPSGQTTQSLTSLTAGTYIVTVTDGNCIVIDSISIIEPSEITDTVTAITACQPSLGSATVLAAGGVGGFTYSWTPSLQTTATATSLDSAMHTVTITDANGCIKVDSVLVQIFPVPVIITIADTSIIYPNCIMLSVTGGLSYSWSPVDDLDCDNCPTPTACPTYATNYCVIGTDANGCTGTDCVLIDVEIICGDVFVPSAFSPNNDGENDLECIYSDCIQNLALKIYNRWGEKVFETNNSNICWDGTWKGKELNSAVFVYILEGTLINGEQVFQKGNISLIR